MVLSIGNLTEKGITIDLRAVDGDPTIMGRLC